MRSVIMLATLLFCASAATIQTKLKTFIVSGQTGDDGKRRIGDMDVWVEDDLKQIWGNRLSDDSIHGFMHDWISNQWLSYDYWKTQWAPIAEEDIPQWAWEALEDYENDGDGEGEDEDDGGNDGEGDGDGEGDDDGCQPIECDDSILPAGEEEIDSVWWYGYCHGDVVHYSGWHSVEWVELAYYYHTKECTWQKDEMQKVDDDEVPKLLTDIINGDFNPEDYDV